MKTISTQRQDAFAGFLKLLSAAYFPLLAVREIGATFMLHNFGFRQQVRLSLAQASQNHLGSESMS
eukprot:3033287-Pleurochrysis_carterae.AAC.3